MSQAVGALHPTGSGRHYVPLRVKSGSPRCDAKACVKLRIRPFLLKACGCAKWRLW